MMDVRKGIGQNIRYFYSLAVEYIHISLGVRGVFVADGGSVRHQRFLDVFWLADYEFRECFVISCYLQNLLTI